MGTFYSESDWKKTVKEKLSKQEAALLIEIYEEKTCIHEDWLKKEKPHRRAAIERVVEKALKVGLLYPIPLASSKAILFPVKKH